MSKQRTELVIDVLVVLGFISGLIVGAIALFEWLVQ